MILVRIYNKKSKMCEVISNPLSLVYTCLRKIKEVNPMELKKIFARYEDDFQDMEFLMKTEKTHRCDIKSAIEYFNGTFFGGAIRDEINGEYPQKYDVLFTSLFDFENFLIYAIDHNYVIISDDIENEYRKIKIIARKTLDILSYYNQEMYEFKKRLCEAGLIQRYHVIDIKLDIYLTYSPSIRNSLFDYINSNFDIDVNQFYYQTTKDKTLAMKIPMKKTISEMKKQIRRKEFKILCKTDCFVSEEVAYQNFKYEDIECFMRNDCEYILDQKKKLEEKGWRCINDVCSNPACIFSKDEEYEKYINDLVYECDIFNFHNFQKEETQNRNIMDQILLSEIDCSDSLYLNFERKIKSKRINDKKREQKKEKKLLRKKLFIQK